MSTHVLLVEDEPAMLRALALNLSARGYHVSTAEDGATGLSQFSKLAPDVIVLDLGLPDLDGMNIIRAVRGNSRTPIVVLSGRSSSRDKVDALEAGADDYVTKPFNVNELVARLRAATRRAGNDPAPTTVTLGPCRIDLDAKTVERDQGGGRFERVALTPTEWHLLDILLTHPDRLIAQSQLLTALRGQDGHTEGSYLRIYMAQLRHKLEQEPSRPRHLLTEPGMGYRYNPGPAAR